MLNSIADGLVEDVRFLSTLGARREEADRLLVLAEEDESLPRAYFSFARFVVDYRQIADGQRFFKELRTLYGSHCKPSETFTRFAKRFERNAEAASRLLPLSREQRSRIKNHRWPPFAEGMPEILKRLVPSFPSIRSIRYVASGTYGDVYRLCAIDDTLYALKIFHPISKLQEDEDGYFSSARASWYSRVVGILGNLHNKKDYLQRCQGLLKLFHVPDPHVFQKSEEGWFSIWEYNPGQNVGLLRTDGLSSEQKGNIIAFYGRWLRTIHQDGYLVGDMSWNNVLLDGSKPAICDADTICTLTEARNPEFLPGRICSPFYSSHARLTSGVINPYSELEGFALMIDDLFNGGPWLPLEGLRQRITEAELNRRDYPAQRMDLLPTNLRDAIAPVLQYPQDTSLTIDDLIDATHRDFSIHLP